MATVTPIGQSTPVKDKGKSTRVVIHNQGKPKSKANLKQCFESDVEDYEEFEPATTESAPSSPPSKSKIVHQMAQRLPRRPFKCEECGKSFKDKHYMKLHTRTHSGEKPHPCENCGKSFASLSNLITHKKIHSEERPYPCNQCDKSFKFKPYLKDHIVRCHIAKDPIYPSKSIENDTGKLFPCDKCPKYSTTKHSLKVHQLTHTAEKAFACDQCEKTFTLKWNLQVHQQRHLEAKPFLCKSCNKTFKTTGDLYRHKWIWKHGVRISKCQ